MITVEKIREEQAYAFGTAAFLWAPDLVEKAKAMIADAKQVAPDKPFFMYFFTSAAHAPHHVPKEWADRYRGKFDEGWDACREKVFARQKELGLVPKEVVLSPHDPDVQDWTTLAADERRLYTRMKKILTEAADVANATARRRSAHG
jgi:arylsulfatase